MQVNGRIDLEINYTVSDTTIQSDLRLFKEFLDDCEIATCNDRDFKDWLNENPEIRNPEDVSLHVVSTKVSD